MTPARIRAPRKPDRSSFFVDYAEYVETEEKLTFYVYALVNRVGHHCLHASCIARTMIHNLHLPPQQ